MAIDENTKTKNVKTNQKNADKGKQSMEQNKKETQEENPENVEKETQKETVENPPETDSSANVREIVIDITKAEDFKQFYSIGAMGIHNIYDFRLSFYNDEPTIPNNNVQKFKRVIGTEVILSPIAAMDLANWLNKNLEEYEQRFGPIRNIYDRVLEQAQKANDPKKEEKEFGMDGYA